MSKSWRVKIKMKPTSSQRRVVVLAHKTAPVLIPNMHLTGGIADGLFALLAKFRLEVS
jgi:hypothetical protein